MNAGIRVQNIELWCTPEAKMSTTTINWAWTFFEYEPFFCLFWHNSKSNLEGWSWRTLVFPSVPQMEKRSPRQSLFFPLLLSHKVRRENNLGSTVGLGVMTSNQHHVYWTLRLMNNPFFCFHSSRTSFALQPYIFSNERVQICSLWFRNVTTRTAAIFIRAQYLNTCSGERLNR